MKYSKTITLKDGRTCIIRNGTERDAEGALANFILTHGQTDFLTTYPDEITFTLDQERAYLKGREESEQEVELIAEVDGRIVGMAGVSRHGTAEKVRHRASFGISIGMDYWGLGVLNWAPSRTTKEPLPFIRAWALQSTAEIPGHSSPGAAAGRRLCSCGWNWTGKKLSFSAG